MCVKIGKALLLACALQAAQVASADEWFVDCNRPDDSGDDRSNEL